MYCQCTRHNPDEDYRHIERLTRSDDSLENRVRLLAKRLQIGNISLDRVEAAAVLGSPEASSITPVSSIMSRHTCGINDMPWAINVLTDHLPLRPFIARAVLHAIQEFCKVSGGSQVLTYVTSTFADPRYIVSRRSPHPEGRLIGETLASITELFRGNSEGKINNLVTAIRNTWYFSGQIPEPEWRWEASDRAYATLLLVSERVRQLDPWQHQYLIDSLLGT